MWYADWDWEAWGDWGGELAGLSLADEMEDIELGQRVSHEWTFDMFASIYSELGDRVKAQRTLILGRLERVGESNE